MRHARVTCDGPRDVTVRGVGFGAWALGAVCMAWCTICRFQGGEGEGRRGGATQRGARGGVNHTAVKAGGFGFGALELCPLQPRSTVTPSGVHSDTQRWVGDGGSMACWWVLDRF